MFPLFLRSYTLLSTGILHGATDVHSHILSGVDDGSASVSESRELLTYLEQLGYRHVIFTPHTMEECNHTSEDLISCFSAFKQQYQGGITLRLSSEYMLDNSFSDRLDKGEILPWGNTQYMLVETSYVYPPEGFKGLLKRVLSSGYFPVLAHPERYHYMTWQSYFLLKEMGVLFQLNLNSLSGYYGPSAKEKSLSLLDKGLYDYVGTDIHHLSEHYLSHFERIRLTSKQLKSLEALFDNNKTL